MPDRTLDPSVSAGLPMGYRFFDHTGDVGIALEAPDLPGLFADAAAAFTDTVVDRGSVRADESAAIGLDAPDVDALLVDWLSELLFRFETGGWLTRDAAVAVRVDAAAGCHLDAIVRGERYDPARHPARVLVKAVTYHALSVQHTAAGVSARVVLDI